MSNMAYERLQNIFLVLLKIKSCSFIKGDKYTGRNLNFIDSSVPFTFLIKYKFRQYSLIMV